MKYRSDFVTNSSSSSFVCDVCGRTETDYNLCISEAGMYQCENGHCFCTEEATCLLQNLSDAELRKRILEKEIEYWTSDRGFVKCTEDELQEEDRDSLIEIFCENDYEVSPDMCPICSFVEYQESDLVAFLFKKYGVQFIEVEEHIKQVLPKQKIGNFNLEYICHVCKLIGTTPANEVATWPEQFKSYREFQTYCYQ